VALVSTLAAAASKGAIVNLETGLLIGERIRIDTPQPATPEAVADVIAEITRAFEWDGPVGATLPSVIQQQIVKTAANIDKSWIGVNANELFSKCLPNQEVAIVNDADAAGIAELKYGAAKDTDGLVVLLTFWYWYRIGRYVQRHSGPQHRVWALRA